MDKRSSTIEKIFPAIFLALAFFYIHFVIQTRLIFHHQQPPFLLSYDFWSPYFKYPGGLSELVSNFLMQSYYSKYWGTLVFFIMVSGIAGIFFALLNALNKFSFNRIFALIPITFGIVLANDYNLPFSIFVSVIIVLSFLFLLAKTGKNIVLILLIYSIGALSIYYFSGSGYLLLFSLASIFLFPNLTWKQQLLIIVYILGFSLFIPWLTFNYILPLPPDSEFLYFFPSKMYFMEYKPSVIFDLFLISLPLTLLITRIICHFQKNKNQPVKHYDILSWDSIFGYTLIVGLAFFSHKKTFNSDIKKIVTSDFYCYINNIGKTAKAATTLKNYSFEANLNYNLLISKTGHLTDDFFNFFQISSTDALFPDNRFQSEMSFIASDYYYNLGYISEARHWAYESLVFYPHSLRALQILVKIHLVLREYNAAERCLHILNKGIIDQSFVQKYMPYIKDKTLISNDKDIMEKRSFIVGEHELSPNIDQRFKELLKANKGNKNAYEHLMMYYLLEAELDNFMELYKEVGNYFDKPVNNYEDAVLMYGATNKIPVEKEYKISAASIARFNKFNEKRAVYKGNSRLAMEEMYPEFGNTYLFYLQLIYPRILKPLSSSDDEDLPAI